jgi:hypothetical protein
MPATAPHAAPTASGSDILHAMRPVFPSHGVRVTRRELLRLLLGLAAWLPTGWLLAASRPVRTPASRQMVEPPPALGTLIDVLLPRDQSPSGTDLDIDQYLWSAAIRHEEQGRLVWLLCAWLDREAISAGATDFRSADEALRNTLVRRASESPPGTMPGAAFRFIQDRAFERYYVDPRSWSSLGYDGPPQPQGFPGHAQPPGAAA